MLKFFRYCSFAISFAFFTFGLFTNLYNFALIGILFVLLSNLLYSFEMFKKRVVFLLFNCMMFVFLISRPTISMFKGNVWWYFNDNAVHFALISLFFSLISLQLGAILIEQLICKKTRGLHIQQQKKSYFSSPEFLKSLRIFALILFYFSMFFFMIMEMEKLLFMKGKDYAEFFITFRSELPYIFYIFSSMKTYALCIFLATLPSKKMCFLPLVLYVFSAVPSLIIGLRNPIVLNVLFVLVYYFIRDILVDSKKWIGRFEKTAIIVCFPAALLFLSAYNYIRDGTKAATSGVIDSIIDLIYKQGVSFDVLCIGYDSIPKLPNIVPKNYTFGPIIDYFSHNSLAQNLFGAKDLGIGNNEIQAIYGNSLAHSMSYVSKSDYLQGHGWGTSFLLETYVDFGYIGLILFSLLIGAGLIYIIHIIGKKWLSTAISFTILTNIFFMPRAETVSPIFFLVTAQFWIPLFACFVISLLFARNYSFKANRLFLQNRACNKKLIQ